jgi:hypothetical protein
MPALEELIPNPALNGEARLKRSVALGLIRAMHAQQPAVIAKAKQPHSPDELDANQLALWQRECRER